MEKINGTVSIGTRQSLAFVLAVTIAGTYAYTTFNNRLEHVEKHLAQTRDKNEHLERSINDIKLANARIEATLSAVLEAVKKR
jgi:septal ring factor EnvC (AmiA/AmiB activator)